jgi:hypothetical protein
MAASQSIVGIPRLVLPIAKVSVREVGEESVQNCLLSSVFENRIS